MSHSHAVTGSISVVWSAFAVGQPLWFALLWGIPMGIFWAYRDTKQEKRHDR